MYDASDWENEIVEYAKEHYANAFELSLSTGDFDLFYKTIQQAEKDLLSQTVSALVEKGLVEMTGVNDDGELVFSLTESGLSELNAHKNQ